MALTRWRCRGRSAPASARPCAVDAMGNRIDELEKNINGLLEQAGVDEAASASAPGAAASAAVAAPERK